ncbi:cyclic nucleotide-binding domain-containing protein [Thalassobaculum sp.]|uniref:cyclic nucleotide-binding domain-containing protein n=1 Tax=Thalassobaculum sp. TaxID=2022740 RepID=UPI0032F00487
MADTRPTIAEELRSNRAFEQLSPKTIDSMATVSRRLAVSPGDLIVREGEENSDLFLFVAGTAVAVRNSEDGGLVVLNAIAPGDCIGELTFLGGGRRSASVRAETECDVIQIPAEALQSIPDAPAVIGDLKGALASVVVNRARSMSDEMLASLRRQLEIKTIQNQFGHFLIFTMAMFLIATALFYLVAEEYVQNVYDPGFSWQAVIFLAVPCLLIIKIMKIPMAELGIKREGLARSLGEAVAICVVITIPALIYLFAFKPRSTASEFGVTVDAFFLVQYFFHTIFQEVGSRGLLQGLFQKFLDDTKGHKAILLTSTVFASLHLAFGIDAVIITFVASIVFGYVYLRQKNLIGVTVLHYWLGVLAATMVAF